MKELKKFTVMVFEKTVAEVIVEAEDELDAKCKALEIAQTQDLDWESDEGVYAGSIWQIS